MESLLPFLIFSFKSFPTVVLILSISFIITSALVIKMILFL